MKRDTHKRIAQAIADWLGIQGDLRETFIRAICRPDDVWRGQRRRRYRGKHHFLRYWLIMNLIKSARRNYLRGELSRCLSDLGMALHYVQDAYIPSPRWQRRVHARMEAEIDGMEVLSKDIEYGFKHSQSSPRFVAKLVSGVRWRYDAEEAFREAVRTSAMLVAAVFGPKEPPNGLLEAYANAKMRHKRLVIKAWIAFLIGTGLSVALTSISALLTLLGLIISGAVGLGMVLRNEEFYRLKVEVEWYGVDT